MSNVLLTLLSPFTRAISTMLYLVGVAVGMATGVMVGFGETISAPAKAVGRLLPANQTHGTENVMVVCAQQPGNF